MLSTTNKVYVIASRQRRGDVTKTAENTGFSPSYVSRVFRGLRNNEMILSEGYRIASRRMKNIDPNGQQYIVLYIERENELGLTLKSIPFLM